MEEADQEIIHGRIFHLFAQLLESAISQGTAGGHADLHHFRHFFIAQFAVITQVQYLFLARRQQSQGIRQAAQVFFLLFVRHDVVFDGIFDHERRIGISVQVPGRCFFAGFMQFPAESAEEIKPDVHSGRKVPVIAVKVHEQVVHTVLYSLFFGKITQAIAIQHISICFIQHFERPGLTFPDSRP